MSFIEATTGLDKSSKEEQKRTRKIKGSLDAPLSVAAVKAGGGLETGRTTTDETDASAERSRTVLRALGGIQALKNK